MSQNVRKSAPKKSAGSEGSPLSFHLPVLPLRDIVIFPQMVVPLFVGRERSVRALEAIAANSETQRRLILVTQKDSETDDPGLDDIYSVGISASMLQMLKMPDGTVKILIEGDSRVRINRIVEQDPVMLVDVSAIATPPYHDTEARALMRSVLTQFETYARLGKKIAPEILTLLQDIDDPGRMADTIAAHLTLRIADKQSLLEQESVVQRLEQLLVTIEQEIDLMQVERRIRGRVKRQMEKSHRDYYLSEQIKAIQNELGDRDNDRDKDEFTELAERIESAGMPADVHKKAESELKKMRHMTPMSAEATVVRNYIDWLVSLPWSVVTTLEHDLHRAEEILEEDHYGLEKVKERILEHLAVQQKVEKMKGPILCLVGPPGVGKTSLAKSIARASGRQYVRISLGGIRDEAEIRGHRRTYIGSMPGKIIQSIKKAGSSNPLFLLDEIDKVGSDYRGDPSSALLEVLDPEQNNSFTDHYMEVDYDLSGVMFITTANSLNIPKPLLDRMEVIRIAGYTEEEKMHIARKYLVPKQMEAHGLKQAEFSVSNSAIIDMIRYYTREAGVRNLEREIATLTRKSTRSLLTDKRQGTSVSITTNNLAKYLGIRQFRFGLAEEENLIGVSTGLAWTSVGGELLSIEAIVLDGKGRLTITGKLGDVMQESAQAAMTYARMRAREWIL
ncbi:MAG: endopeptidase La, partial [Magnetococcales bacterium]|nr:endopeptidase La [Magnetococcales bacterium]